MFIRNIIKMNFDRFFWILIMCVMIFLHMGCFLVIDPVMKDEVYRGISSDASKNVVYAHVIKTGEKYKDGADTIWFVQSDGTTWRLSGLSGKPKLWELICRYPDGKEENIPLKQFEWNYQDATKWPGKWSLTPVNQP